MNTGIFAIYDLDCDYAESLLGYICGKQNMPFETIAFTKEEKLMEYAKDHHIDILLISQTAMKREIAELSIDKIILLSSGNILSEYIDYAAIYKYQSTENILREVLDYYVDIHPNHKHIHTGRVKAKIIGVYSPLELADKSTFSFTLGQILAKDYRTLYLNMEEFAVLDKFFERSEFGDLSDLMYFYLQNPNLVTIKLQGIVRNFHDLFYVPPMAFSEDLRNIATEEWVNMITRIGIEGDFDRIIIDFSNMVGDVFMMLDMCDEIYMPIQNSGMALMKVTAYEEYLLKTGRNDIMQKTIQIKIPKTEEPKWDESYLEEQVYGTLGAFIKKIIGEAA